MANREIWKSFRTLLVVISVTFSILIVFFAIYQNSIFDIPKDYNVLIERIQDTTTNIQKTRNTITIRDGEEKNSYISEPVAGKLAYLNLYCYF
ncbi:hypothetical protein VIGAN_07004700 [Vigna angularis var. angularis]|uniref:Uncharacterized protein n=1 Tax=Vigna angularis var. angularis TaxID=157739 RepID=A0A0S3SF40_PHAAN|nr:hypothetical protein VIGAN_07004700 [Vigna angularis var. angularis]